MAVTNSRISNKVKIIIRIIATLALAFLFIIYTYNLYNNRFEYTMNKERIVAKSDMMYQGFAQGDTLGQTFETDKTLKGFAFANRIADNPKASDFRFVLTDLSNNKVVLDKTINSSLFVNGDYFVFLDKAYEIDGITKFEIEVTSLDDNLDISFLANSEDVYASGEAIHKGEEQKGDFQIMLLEKVNNGNLFLVYKVILLFIVFIFIGLHFWLDLKKMYHFMHRYRYLLAFGLLLFLIINKIHFSNIGAYGTFLQDDTDSAFVNPIFGEVRAIRSDEWRVTIPRLLAGQFTNPPYMGNTDIMNAAMDTTYAASGISWSLAALAKPEMWLFLFANVEYAFSFFWCFKVIATFMVGYEISRILSKDKRLLSLAGAILLTFNQFFGWWSLSFTYTSSLACVVFLYYFLMKEKKWHKILAAFGMVIAAASFVVQLYPAWQVPNGYITLVLFVWIIVSNFDKVKALKKSDVAIVLGALVLLAGVMVSFYLEEKDYMAKIMSTVYPAGRVCTGGFSLYKIFLYLQSLFYPFKDIGGVSEISMFFTLYPLPTIIAVILWVKNKDKKKDLLTPLLLGLSFIFTLYCLFPLPEFVAKILLLTFSTDVRLVDSLGLIQVLLLIHVLGYYKRKSFLNPVIGGVIALINAGLALLVSHLYYPEYMDVGMSVGGGIFVFLISLLLISDFGKLRIKKEGFGTIIVNRDYLYKSGLLITSVVILVTGVCVNPISRTLDAIYTRPLVKGVAEIVQNDKEATWIMLDNNIAASVLIATGAKTLNSTNISPNYGLWKILDPEKKMEEYWNRYAHMDVVLTSDDDVDVELLEQDTIRVFLPISYLKKLNISYVCCKSIPESLNNEEVTFENVYWDGEYNIYKVV